MNMKLKRTTATFTAFLLAMPTILVSAESEEPAEDSSAQGPGAFDKKDEVIYANLDSSGAQQDLYVVNNFTVSEEGTITDYGSYSSVQNLTDLTAIEQEDDRIEFTAQEDEFYYQGNLDNQALPWEFDITYELNGEEMTAEELAGEEGELQIQIDTAKNEEGQEVFFNNYLLQITMTFDSERYKNIQAPDGTIANAGKDRQVTFTVLPESEESFTVNADVTDLEMDSIQIAAVPSNMAIEAPDTENLKEEVMPLADATSEVNRGVGELRDGVAELNDGVGSLYNGSAQYLDGINQLQANSGSLVEGSDSIKGALQQLSQAVGAGSGNMNLSQFTELTGGLRQIAGGLGEVQGGLTELSGQYSQAYGALDQAVAAIPEAFVSEADIQALYESGADPATVDQLVQSYQASLAVKETYNAVSQAFDAISPALETSAGALTDLQSTLNTMADQLETSLSATSMDESLQQLQEGLQTLSANYDQFHSGLVSYTGGVGELAGSYGELHNGLAGVNEGTGELENGAVQLNDGTAELADATSDLPDQIEVEINELIGEFDKSDFEPVSFVSEQNENVETVQFVIKTAAIQKPDEEQTEDAVQEEKSFWDRLVDLFR